MARLLDLLALVGRYGTQGFALSLVVGLAVPQLAALARPLLPVCIFAFIVLTLARADLPRIRAGLANPLPLVLATLWLLVVPAAVTALIVGVARDALAPGEVLGLAIIGASPPLLSAPAIAALLGLEPSLLLVATLATTFLSPLTAPALASFVAGEAVPLDRAALALRLALVVGGGFVVAALWRGLVGASRIAARRRSIDGMGVVIYGVFAVAAMDGVAAAILAEPARAARMLGLVFLVAAAATGLSLAVLRRLAPGDRLVVGYAAGQRNMGIVVAALGAAIPDTTYLFFALAQFPIYLLPMVLRAVAARLPAADRLPPRERA